MTPSLPIPIHIASVETLGRVLRTLEAAMRGAAGIWQPSWIAISHRRERVTLEGILPRPANTNNIIFSSGTSARLTGRRDRLDETFPVDADIDTLERHYLNLCNRLGQPSAAGFLLRPDSFIAFHQQPDKATATAELMIGPHVGGHAAMLEIEAIMRDFPGLLVLQEERR